MITTFYRSLRRDVASAGRWSPDLSVEQVGACVGVWRKACLIQLVNVVVDTPFAVLGLLNLLMLVRARPLLVALVEKGSGQQKGARVRALALTLFLQNVLDLLVGTAVLLVVCPTGRASSLLSRKST